MSGVDGSEFPSAHKGIGYGVHAGAVLAALAEGKLVDHAGDVIQLHVKAGGSFFGGQVPDVLGIGLVVAGEILERLLGIAHGLAPGERVEDVQAFGETVLHAGRDTIVVVVARGEEPRDGPESRYRHAGGDTQALARKVGIRLVVIGDDGQPQTVVPVVGEVDHRVLGELALQREEPVLHIRPFAVRRGVDDVGINRVEGRWAGDVGAEAVQGGEEGGRHRAARRYRLAEDAEKGLRSIDSLLGAAGPVEERVADAISGADYGFGIDAVRQAKPRPVVFVVRVDQAALEQVAAGGFDHAVGGGVEIGVIVVPLIERGSELPAQSEVQRKFRVHPVVVLEIQRVHVLPQIDHRVAPQVHLVGNAKHEIRQAVAGGVARDRAGGRLAQLSAGGPAEQPGVRVLSIDWIRVQNLGADVQVLVSHFERMPAHRLGEIEFRIPGRGILELRIAGLAAHGGESGDGLRVESTGDAGCGRQALKATEHGSHARAAQIGGRLAAKDMGETHAEFDERGGRDRPGVAEGRVLIDDVDVPVAVAARRTGEGGCVILQVLALAVTQERRHAIVDLGVEFGVVFVAVVANQ